MPGRSSLRRLEATPDEPDEEGGRPWHVRLCDDLLEIDLASPPPRLFDPAAGWSDPAAGWSSEEIAGVALVVAGSSTGSRSVREGS